MSDIPGCYGEFWDGTHHQCKECYVKDDCLARFATGRLLKSQQQLGDRATPDVLGKELGVAPQAVLLAINFQQNVGLGKSQPPTRAPVSAPKPDNTMPAPEPPATEEEREIVPPQEESVWDPDPLPEEEEEASPEFEPETEPVPPPVSSSPEPEPEPEPEAYAGVATSESEPEPELEAYEAKGQTVRIGQIWRDCRNKHRRVQVISINGDTAVCKTVRHKNNKQVGKETVLTIARMYPHAKGWELMEEKEVAPKEKPKKSPPPKKKASPKSTKEVQNPPMAGLAKPATGPAKKTGRSAKTASGRAGGKKQAPEWSREHDLERWRRERQRNKLVAKLKPGMRLFAEWEGEKYQLTVRKGSYVLRGENYPTLYAATKAVVGTRKSPKQLLEPGKEDTRPKGDRDLVAWSGPRFWKLRDFLESKGLIKARKRKPRGRPPKKR